MVADVLLGYHMIWLIVRPATVCGYSPNAVRCLCKFIDNACSIRGETTVFVKQIRPNIHR